MHAQVPGGDELWDDLPARPSRTGPIDRAIEVVGDRWSLLILHEALFRGTTRFGEFNRALRIPTNILTRRLQALVEAGVFERVSAPQGRSLHEYRPTVKGQHLWPVLAAFLDWGTEWLTSGE